MQFSFLRQSRSNHLHSIPVLKMLLRINTYCTQTIRQSCSFYYGRPPSLGSSTRAISVAGKVEKLLIEERFWSSSSRQSFSKYAVLKQVQITVFTQQTPTPIMACFNRKYILFYFNRTRYPSFKKY